MINWDEAATSAGDGRRKNHLESNKLWTTVNDKARVRVRVRYTRVPRLRLRLRVS